MNSGEKAFTLNKVIMTRRKRPLVGCLAEELYLSGNGNVLETCRIYDRSNDKFLPTPVFPANALRENF